ncbi:hypothetical protein ACFOYW_13680 [Gryllotalpicola reticulitermitis]|uniref:Polymerase nucleotidyl transferase domain-containing protein n=1 Tax=Gryllotalpicola reticulitermitis TaxID=1184153 RepID=A0ABV8Q9V7_9MICO
MAEPWDLEQARLQERAEDVRRSLGLDEALGQLGTATLVGSAALGVMVARDVDVTVSVTALGPDELLAISRLAASLAIHSAVREVRFRNDTGAWNIDANYPDGVYLGIECADERGELWTFDIWFVDQPERQPDLRHLREIAPRITPERQAAILAIKWATMGRRPDGSRLPSYEIYAALAPLPSADARVTRSQPLR